MLRLRWIVPIVAGPWCVPASAAYSQDTSLRTAEELNRAGVVAMDGRDPAAALAYFENALAVDSTNAEANWRAALALVDMATAIPAESKSLRRDSMLVRAERMARRAIAGDSPIADPHFVLAFALGERALGRGRSERLRVAKEVRDLAVEALRLDPNHAGAHHVLGRWHAEAMRLSGVSRFLARTLLGGGILGEASWEEAIRHLEAAVASRPAWIYHRLDLARVYLDRDRYEDARKQLEMIDTLPLGDLKDPQYKEVAADLLRRMRDR